MKRLLPIAAVPALLLAGCATGPSFDQKMASYLGLSEAQVVENLGVPARTYDADGVHFLQYEHRRLVSYPAPVMYGWGGPWGGPWGGGWGPYGYGYSQAVSVDSCDVTFALQGGKVQRISHRGNACY